MRLLIGVFVLSVMLAMTIAVPVAAIESNISKAPVYHKERHQGHDTKTNDVIGDLAFPWPFGRLQGMAAADSDGDGVIDSRDRCPGTVAGVKVDKYGCLITQMESDLLDTGLIRTTEILFERDSADLKPESRRVLDEIGEILDQYPELEIEISGHTDAVGADEYNEGLSKRRAQTVKEYLLRHFSSLKANHLKAAGYGESRPVAPNDTVSGRQENRRVEFKVLNEESLQRSRG